MANKVRLIDANALPYENQVLSCDDEWCLKVSDIEKAPTIDPESLRPKGRVVLKERRRGGFCKVRGLDENGIEHTVMVDTRNIGKEPYCSECNAALADSFQIYCPRCGADMRGGADGNTEI